MQAVRLARYHTGRSHLVRFCGAYHGWWGDVQPGVGNPRPQRETYTLRDMDERSAARPRPPPRYRLRAGESAAGAASQRGRAGRRLAGRQRARRPLRPGGVRRVAAPPARRLLGPGHRAHLRRGLRGLPPRPGRRAGILRRARGPGDLRQDAGRRPSRRRAVRAQGTDAALPRRTGRPTSASRAARSTRTPSSCARCRCSWSASRRRRSGRSTTGSTSAGTPAPRA